jgi:Zn-dependent alcohol dehydrogenases
MSKHMANVESEPQLIINQYNENYQLRTDVPVPAPGPGELLIRVAAAGFCHTDYQVYQGVYGTNLPITGSHEPAGTVVKIGSDVPGDWKVDDRVGVINFREPCNACNGCRWRMKTYSSLDARYCENKTMSGILKADGGFAEYMIASHYAVVRLPRELSFEQAAPLMCAGVCLPLYYISVRIC